MFDREQLEEAVTLLSRRRELLGRDVVATTLAVLREQLAALPSPAPAVETIGRVEDEQRKQVTILFANIAGLTGAASGAPDAERLELINQLWRRLNETINYHGGVIDKYMGDVLMGLFGVPMARENDPERAVRCALAMQETVRDFMVETAHLWPAAGATEELTEEQPGPAFRLRIGVNTGPVVLGRLGSDTDFTVIGDPVNVASRLHELTSESGVYIGQDTFRLVQDLFQVEPLGQVSVKGRRTPVTVFRVTGTRPRLFFPIGHGVEGVVVPMVGRDRELEQLQAKLAEIAKTGRGSLMTIVGEAGVGKSRLVREFSRRMESFPVKAIVFQGRTEQRMQQAPYSLIRDVVTGHFGIQDSDRPATVEEKLLRGLSALSPFDRRRARPSAGARARVQAIARLIGLDTASRELRLSPGESPAARARAIDAILDFFVRATAHSGVAVVFLEDIHWADNDSLDLVERLGDLCRRAPLFIICLTRPMLFERWPAWPDVATDSARIDLAPLSEQDSRELVRSILRKLPDIPADLCDLIVKSSGGNPYYVEELIKVLIEDGVILPGEEEWQARPGQLTRVRIPATLTGVLQARLDRLPELERVTLQQAAVVGEEFWDSAVQQINLAAQRPFAPEQVAAALQALERRDMVYRSPASAFSGSQAYVFKHAVLREVAYESVLLRDRPVYHRAAAAWLVAGGERVAEYAAPIAAHYELAGDQTRAAEMYETAAGRAEEQHNSAGAIRYYNKVLNIVRGLPQHVDRQLRAQERLGHVLRAQARFVEAAQIFQVMQQTAALDGNLPLQARADNALATINLTFGLAEAALADARRAEQAASLSGAQLESIQALHLQAEATRSLGRWDASRLAAQEALQLAQRLGEPEEIGRGFHQSGLTALAAGDLSEARELTDQFQGWLNDPAKKGASPVDPRNAYRLGRLYIALGESTPAALWLSAALFDCRAAGDQAAEAETFLALGELSLPEDPQTAEQHCREALALAENIGRVDRQLRYRLDLGRALLATGQPEAAERELRWAIELAEDETRLGRWAHLAEAHRLLAEALAN